MQIQVSLNAHGAAAAELRAQLDAGLRTLERPGVEVRVGEKASAAEAFGLVEAYQFIVDCGPGIVALLPLATAVLQLSTAILERRRLGQRKAKARRKGKRAARAAEAGAPPPVVVVNVNGRELGLPADDRQVRKFMSALVTER